MVHCMYSYKLTDAMGACAPPFVGSCPRLFRTVIEVQLLQSEAVVDGTVEVTKTYTLLFCVNCYRVKPW